jgi:PAS domain S-box-containing protein
VDALKCKEDSLIESVRGRIAELERQAAESPGEHSLLSRALAEMQNTLGELEAVEEALRESEARKSAIEEWLQESEERFRLLVDGVQDYAIFMLDPDGKIASWNAGAERINGCSAAEILGRHFSRFYTPEDLQEGKPARELELASAQGRYEEEGWRVRGDGSRYWASVIISALRDETGALRGFANVTRDVTARREAEAALRNGEARLAGIIGSATDAIISTDEAQRIILFNAAAERMFGCDAAAVLGQPMDRLIPERFRKIHRKHHRKFGRTGVSSRSMTSPGTLTALRADGEEFPIEATISQVLVGDQRLFTIILRDVTERNQMEEALRRHAEELERADRAKDQFLAMLAHELRNPIGTINSAAHLLKLLGRSEPRLVRAREIIERQVSHTSRLLDDLLNVSRIARGKITLHPIRLDLARLVRDTAADFRGAVEAAGLTLFPEMPEEPIWMDGDPTRLAQAVGNLLHNAIKFTEPGGHITVGCSGVQVFRCSGVQADKEGCDADLARPEHLNTRTPEHLNTHAVITVRDTGIGIEPEVLPHVFETFIQADRGLDRSRGGLGLGLALVKGLVELHGGEVRAASEGAGRGAEFTLLLPLAPASGVAEEIPSDAPAFSGSIRILIVEDNSDAAEVLRTVLELFGCRVEVAHSGPEALETARASRPEVILCDLGLPGMSGYEVAAALRQDPATAATRLIAVSGYGQEEDQQRSRAAGFDVHLTKPVDVAQLRRLLEAGAGEARFDPKGQGRGPDPGRFDGGAVSGGGPALGAEPRRVYGQATH